MYNLKKHVIKEFSTKKAQQVYIGEAEKGLWPSERLLIKKYFKKRSKILDLGCGTGRTTIDLFKLKYDVIGVDLVPLMIKNAKKIAKKKKLSIKYKVGDATKLKFKDKSFDNVLFSYNGWAQIPGKENRIKALEEINRVLKPNGYFIFTTHFRILKSFFKLWIKMWFKIYLLKPLGLNIREADFGDLFFKYKGRDEQFIHIPSKREVKKQLLDVGFKIILMEKSNIISPKDKLETPPNFYVCRK